ncbi:MAG TPA: thiamine phosphate synthase [Blastocatellia bacterium]|nr:thiamine phosphate synthase [Blastocatellia bacterium]
MTALPVAYPITDTRISGLSHAEQVEVLASAGASVIQLRDKTASPLEFYKSALKALDVARAFNVTIIINDRVDVAVASGADGVHLGQDDIPPSAARRLLGADKIIGYSTHNLDQAIQAESEPVDYIAIGPVFDTATKAQPDPTVGLDLVRRVRERIKRPLVAIGGITLDRASVVLAAGAQSLAVISDLYSVGDPASRLKAYLQLVR